jgi:hypothetical protein
MGIHCDKGMLAKNKKISSTNLHGIVIDRVFGDKYGQLRNSILSVKVS